MPTIKLTVSKPQDSKIKYTGCYKGRRIQTPSCFVTEAAHLSTEMWQKLGFVFKTNSKFSQQLPRNMSSLSSFLCGHTLPAEPEGQQGNEFLHPSGNSAWAPHKLNGARRKSWECRERGEWRNPGNGCVKSCPWEISLPEDPAAGLWPKGANQNFYDNQNWVYIPSPRTERERGVNLYNKLL